MLSRSYLIVMDVIVRANSINAIVTAQVSSSNREMIGFHVDSEIENNMKLGTVDKDQVMYRGIFWRNQTYEARAISARNSHLPVRCSFVSKKCKFPYLLRFR
jgi:hypothetical protein